MEQFHTDGGGEYKTSEVSLQSDNTRDSPQQNPFAERTNRTIVEPVRLILEAD